MDTLALSDQQKRSFVSDGYVILRDFIPSDKLEAATSFIDHAASDGKYQKTTRKILGEDIPVPDFDAAIRKAPQVVELIFRTALQNVVADLFGTDLADVTGNEGHISSIPPCHTHMQRARPVDDRFPKRRWHVDAGDGKYRKKGTAFSLLVTVALSEGQDVDENRGQMMLWPGSHLITHRGIATAAETHADGNALREFLKEKPDCGTPIRALMRRGDVLIAHQRLAHNLTLNLSETTRKNVFFRVAHALIDDIVDEQIRSPTPWVGFEGLAEFIEEGAADFAGKRKSSKKTEKASPAVSSREFFSGGDLRLTREQKETFIKDGFVILPEAVSQELVKTALDFVNQSYEDGKYNLNGATRPGAKRPSPAFYKPIQRAPQIVDLFYKSGLVGVAEELQGKGNPILRAKIGQVAYNPTCELYQEQGKDKTKPHPKNNWHIDAGNGRYAALGSDFSFLVGVCLTEGQDVDESRGQFTVWPGSHLITHPAMGKIVATTPPDDIVRTFRAKRLDVGYPKRALLRPGDAMIAHQRLSHCAGINLVDDVRCNIYFRIMHRDWDDLLDDFVKSPTPWVGFAGLQDFLPKGATEWDREGGAKKGKHKLAASSTGEGCGTLKLTPAQKRSFVKDGYVVLPGAVSAEMVGQALAVVDNAFKNEKYASNGKKRFGSNYPLPLFQKPIRRNQKVRDLFFKSGLVDASEQLIGEGHVTLRENMPDVSFNAQSELAAEEGMGLTEPFPSRKWQMQSGQGFYKGSGGDCNFMVGVALSDGQDVDENRGQFTVWPGSHVIIHPVLSQLVREDPPPDHLLKALRAKKIDVGSPKRILLKPGDAFIAHQRLASTQGINLLKKVRKSVYFKIAHTDYDEMQDEFLESKLPFTGFEPLQDIVADEFGG